MNLLDKFENMPVQDVGTFNSIFKHNPIMGFPFDAEVEICGIGKEDTRIIKVNGEILHKDLTYKEPVSRSKARIKRLSRLKKVSLQETKLPEVYGLLKPAEFMIYSAVKELGSVVGATELAKQLNLSQKTILTNLPKLIKLGLVETEKVATVSGSSFKITARERQ